MSITDTEFIIETSPAVMEIKNSIQSSSYSSTYNYFEKYGYIGYGFTTTGEGVRRVQTSLNSVGIFLSPENRNKCYCGEVDGIFGPKTYQAVKNYQSIHGLTPDGIVGPDTWHVIEQWAINHGI